MDPIPDHSLANETPSFQPARKIGIDFRLAYHRQAGITRYTHNLLQALDQCNSTHHFTVFHHRKQPAHRRYPKRWSHRTLLSPVHHPWEQRTLQMELQWPRLDLVHFPDFIGPYFTSLPTVITVHDLAWLYWPEILDEPARAYYGQLEKAIVHARVVLVPSRHTQSDLERSYPAAKSKTRVIPHAVDPVFLDQTHGNGFGSRSQATKLSLPANYLLHVGTIEPRKNIPVLLETFQAVRQKSRISDLKLVLAGAQGWLYGDLADLITRKGLDSHCIFPGQLTEGGLISAYTQALCVLHPALYEGFGFPLLESMACGTPVVASSASCLPEIGGSAVQYADPNDVDGLASQVLSILHDPELAQSMVAKGYERVSEFSWSRTARQTLSAYYEAMDTN